MNPAPETDMLITEIERFLQRNRHMATGVDEVLAGIRTARSVQHSAPDPAPKPPAESRPRSLQPSEPARHDNLAAAIAGVPAEGALAGIVRGLDKARSGLVWRQDDGTFYPAGADLGDGYLAGNLHALLIGPDGCGYHHADFTLGIFALSPFTLYRDHRHPAPEIYVNLSERTGWRLGDGDWQDHGAGSIIWNAPGALHATRVYDRPFISIFSWLRDVNLPCEVVPRDDWAEIESELAALK